MQVINKDDCDFSYHDSMFGRTSGRYIVLRATFALSTDATSTPSYKDNRFDMMKLAEELGHNPTQTEVRDSVLNMREEKGSLIMEGRKSFKCAGSFFHMPFVSAEKYKKLRRLHRNWMQKRRKIFVLGRGSSRTTHINWHRAFYWSTRSSKRICEWQCRGIATAHTLNNQC